MYIEYKSRKILTDNEGFLQNPEDWSEDLMIFMAEKDGLKLTPQHLEVINTVRSYYRAYAATPPMRGLIALLKKEGKTELGSSIALAKLFPLGAAKSAAKYAGLPKPVRCI